MRQPTPSDKFRQLITDVLNEVLEESDCLRSCLSCTKFDEDKEYCVVTVPPSRPPARIIAFGCPSYVDATLIADPTTPLTKLPAPPIKGDAFFLEDDDIPF